MLTERELATTLAALRFFQANFDDSQEMRELFVEHFADCAPLTGDEIDALCVRLNLCTTGSTESDDEILPG